MIRVGFILFKRSWLWSGLELYYLKDHDYDQGWIYINKLHHSPFKDWLFQLIPVNAGTKCTGRISSLEWTS